MFGPTIVRAGVRFKSPVPAKSSDAYAATLSEARGWLSALVEMSYQSNGYRRIKNPRIWSMHDLSVLVGGGR